MAEAASCGRGGRGVAGRMGTARNAGGRREAGRTQAVRRPRAPTRGLRPWDPLSPAPATLCATRGAHGHPKGHAGPRGGAASFVLV